MGGKKKTKWRKLPLAEFTKECPTTQNDVTKQDCIPELSKDEDTQPTIPLDDYTPENTYQYTNEYSEYTEGYLYPTNCLVYNPVEVPGYPNYMMPAESFCYYYLPPEMTPAPVPDYTTVPYPEYAPPVKDTVYLLLPAPAIRSSHGSPYITYDWRNRRSRRRYEGYAEYAVIPDKNSSFGNKEEKSRGRKPTPNVSSVRSDNQSSHAKTMTSFSESSAFNKDRQKRAQDTNEKRPITTEEKCIGKRNMGFSNGEKNENAPDKQNLKRRKSKEFCGVHSGKATSEKNDSWRDPSIAETCENMTINQPECVKDTENSLGANENDILGVAANSPRNCLNINTPINSLLRDSAKELEEKGVLNLVHGETRVDEITMENDNDHSTSKDRKEKQNSALVQPQSSLPDILSTVHKTPIHNIKPVSDKNPSPKFPGIRSFDTTNPTTEKALKSKVNPSPTSYVPNSLNSELFSNETEIELKKLTSLQSLKANQSIYKLAFDESLTDQSETDSRSPSPVDPETQVPSSLTNAEILIHEADSGSDAGSEDVELIPHRYESETFLNESKHVYVNKLSLAVELLRTQESLPYDDQFKRVSGESNLDAKESKHTGEVNFGFMEDSISFDSFDGQIGNFSSQSPRNAVVTSQSQSKQHSSSSGIVSSTSNEDPFSESCEEAKEVVTTANNQNNTEEVRTGYRRFQVHLRHYFSPRAALVNPCLCCIIM